MKLKITTLVTIEGNQVENIYHSLEDNQDKAYQDLINQGNENPTTNPSNPIYLVIINPQG